MAELDALVRSSPEAADAYAEASRLESALSSHFADEALALREGKALRALAPRPRRWRAGLAVAAALLLAVGGLSWWLAGGSGPSAADTLGPAELRLADGSRLRLGDGAWARVERGRIELFVGEADIEAAPGARFVVVTPEGLVRAEGTSFNVRLRSEEVEDMSIPTMVLSVAVYAGLAQVEHAGEVVQVPAGRVLVFFDGPEEKPRPGPGEKRGEDPPPRRDRGAVGTVKGVDARAGTITLAGMRGGEDRTIPLAEGAKVMMGEKEARLADVKVGVHAVVTLDADGKATAVRLRGEAARRPEEGERGPSGTVKSIDTRARSITLAAGRGGEEKAYTLAEGAKVLVGEVEINLEGVKAGTQASLTLSRDGKVTQVRLGGGASGGIRRPEEGRVGGMVKKVDEKARTITLASQRGGDEKTYPLAEGAKVMLGEKEGTLADIKPDMAVLLRLNRDGKVTGVIARGAGAARPEATRAVGTVKKLDVKASKLTLTLRGGDEKEYSLAEAVRVMAGAKAGKIEDIQEGDTVGVMLDRDGKVSGIVMRGRGDRE
jgi:Cu/Ag efflux protein CusF